ncbi:unnamed protein product, partial [Adineta ricciae]
SISPNLLQNSTIVHAYVPQDVWYEFPSGIQVNDVGQYVDFETPIEKINVHVRGGFIIPMQIPGSNLVYGRTNPLEFLVSLSQSGSASGSLFWDDGDSMDTIESKSYSYFEFNVTTSILFIYGVNLNLLDDKMTQTIEWATSV